MKKNVFALLMATLVLVSLFSVLGIQRGRTATPSSADGLEILSFTTDKDIYSAREEMSLYLTINASQELSDVLVTVEGVVSSKGVKYVAYSSKTNLTTGENLISFTKTLPSCSACAGIAQGTYYIEAKVTHGGEELQATHSIAITSGPNQVIPVDVVVEETRRMGASGSDGVILVDVRNATDYDAAHIKGAVSIPLANFTNGTAALNKSVKIVVYSEDGANSSIATGILMEQGFDRVYNVVGGINAWNESGYPMVSTAEEHPAAPGFELALALVAVLVIALRVRRHR
jgi:MYXO-CTERM domain-containing protein